MAFLRVYYFSSVLMQHTTLTAAWSESAKKPMPVLYLLHGGTDDSTLWFRESDVESLCERYGLLAVSLDARSSSYADMRHGQKFFTYLTQELPEFLAHRLPVSSRREDTLIAGFSMGGQGAVKAALRCPEKYSVCMGLSGARDPVAMYKVWQGMENGPDLRGVEDALGPIDEIYGSENDILYLAKKAAESGKDLPRFFLSCGKEDYAVEYSRAYHQYLKDLGIAHAYYETEGAHGYEAARKALEIALEAMQKEGILK